MADASLDSKVGVKVCRLFDLGIAGNFPLLSQIPETQGPPELIGELSRGTAPQWENLGEPAFESLVRTSEGEASVLFYRTGGSSVMRFADGAEFRLRQNRIEGWTGGGQTLDALEQKLLGPVMAFLLELRGILTLHASAVQAGEGAVVFLAAAGGGKSSLAAAFAAAGFPMLGDDLVAVKEAGGGWEALPGPPRLKLGRESLERLGIPPERLPPVGDHPSKRWLAPDKEGWGPILDTPCGLRRIYLPVRESGSTGGGEPRIVPIDPLQAVQEILRHGCAPGAAEAMGLRASRMERIARLVESVPMDRLAYPNGFEHLDRVIESVLEQLDRKGR